MPLFYGSCFMRDKRRPTLHVITINKVRESNTQISFTGHLTIDGQFAPHSVNKTTAIFINNYEVANRFAALHLKELRKDREWFWDYYIEELPLPHSKYVQIAQLHKNYLVEQLTVKPDITNVESVETKVTEPQYQKPPRKKRVVIPKAFVIKATYGRINAPIEGYLNLDLRVKSLLLAKSTAVFLNRGLAEQFLAYAQTHASFEQTYSFTIETISNNVQKAKTLAQFALPAINRLLFEGNSQQAFEIEVTGADPRKLPDNLAPLKNFTFRESAFYYLCTNLQITDHAYRRAYFDTAKIAKLFLKHVRPFLRLVYPKCKFKIKDTVLEAAQYQWVVSSMVGVKRALLTPVKPPKAPKPPRATNMQNHEQVLSDCYAVEISEEDKQYFQCIDNGLLITSALELARWYDSESVAAEEAKHFSERYQMNARAVLVHRESEQALAPIEQEQQFKLWQWMQE